MTTPAAQNTTPVKPCALCRQPATIQPHGTNRHVCDTCLQDIPIELIPERSAPA